jgi:hypothetical protein
MMGLKKIKGMRNYLFGLAFLLASLAGAQKYKSESSYIKFYSDAPMEDIEAINEKAVGIIDLETNSIAFIVPIKSFEFKKKLMQEHFNENYLESDKFPKAVFKGSIGQWNGEEGENEALATGEMEIHGIKQQIEIKGTISKSDDKMSMSSVFSIKLEDYQIKIPTAVFYKIAEVVEVTVKFDFKPL